MRQPLVAICAALTLVVGLAGCQEGSSTADGAVSAATKAAGSDQVQGGTFLVKDGKVTWASISVLKGDSTVRYDHTGEEIASPDNRRQAYGAKPGSEFPVAEVTTVAEGVTCPAGSVYADVFFTPAGKVWSQASCESNGEPSKQRLDGKPVADLPDVTSAEALTTVLAEAKAVFGDSPTARLIQIEAGRGDAGDIPPSVTVVAEVAALNCAVGMPRGAKVKAKTQPGVMLVGIGCDSSADSAGQPYPLDKVSGEALAKAIAAGLKAAGGGKVQTASVNTGSSGEVVVEVLSTERGKFAAVTLDGKVVQG